MLNLEGKSLKWAPAIIFLSIGIFLSGCSIDFTPDFRSVTTSVSGTVKHKYLQHPMAGVLVNAYSYRYSYNSNTTEILDSAYTDANGYFSMSFTHLDNAGTSSANQYYVYCPGYHFDSTRHIQPNASNVDILLLPYIVPIMKLSFTVSHLKHPPLEVSLPMGYTFFIYTNGDSTVYTRMGLDSAFQITCNYKDENFDDHTKTESFNPGNIYKDSFSYHVDVDASKF